jgi:hypothetical protein
VQEETTTTTSTSTTATTTKADTTTTVKTTEVTHSMPVISTPPYCSDTDTVVLGNRVTADIYKKGVTHSAGWGHRGNPDETDYCINQTTLMEYSCWTFSDMPVPEKIDCPEGCLDGACVRSATTKTDRICFDSDGGIVYGGAGEVEDFDGTVWTKHKDTCLDNGFLIEWYCEDLTAKNTTTKCPATCGYGGMCYTTLQSTWATTTTTLT